MTRGTPSAVTTPFRAETSEPIYLVHIATGGTPANVYYCTGDADVEMGGLTWTARPMEISDADLRSHEELSDVPLSIADGDGNWKTLLDAGADFVSQRVVIYKTDRSALGSGNPLTDTIRDDFVIDGWERAYGAVKIQLERLMAMFDRMVPIGTITRRDFPGLPNVGTTVR